MMTGALVANVLSPWRRPIGFIAPSRTHYLARIVAQMFDLGEPGTIEEIWELVTGERMGSGIVGRAARMAVMTALARIGAARAN